MYDDPANIRSCVIKIRVRPDQARFLAALADANRMQLASLVYELTMQHAEEISASRQHIHPDQQHLDWAG